MTAVELERCDRTFDGRFRILLDIAGKSHEFQACESLRIIPGMRLVCRGIWQGERVVAKIFLPQRGLQRRIDREVTGIKALAAAGVPVPRLMGTGSLSGDGRMRVLLFEEICEIVSLRDEIKARRNGEEKLPLLKRAVELVARQHNAGIMQTDLHLDNFLLQGEKLFALDGGTVVPVRGQGKFKSDEGLQNIALLLAQLPISADRHIPSLYDVYVAVRGTVWDARDLELLRKHVRRLRDRRLQIILRKTSRECTDYFVVRRNGASAICRREFDSAEMRRFLDDPDKAMQSGRMLKNGRSTTVVACSLGGHELVVKRYNFHTVRRVLRYLFRPTQGFRSWKNSVLLEALGIPHARGIAYLERRIGPVKRSAYFVSERVEGVDARTLFSNGSAHGSLGHQQWSPIHQLVSDVESTTHGIMELLESLTAARLSHGDLKGTNIIFHEGVPTLIDLDGMRRHRMPNSLHQATRRDALRLLQNFALSSPHYRRLAGAAGEKLGKKTHGTPAEQFPQRIRHREMILKYRIDSPVPLMSRHMLDILLNSASPSGECTEILKTDLRRSIFRVVVGDTTMVVKAFPFARLKDKWRWKRYAAAESDNAFQARTRGIPTPEYYGLFQIRRRGLVSNCGVVMEDLKDFHSVDQLSQANEQDLLLAVPMLVELFEAGVNHMDPSPFNLLLHRQSGRRVILDWQYASFTTRRNAAQLVLQGSHFLRYANVSPGTSLWERFVRELYQAGSPGLSADEFREAVQASQGIRLRPRERTRFVERGLRAA